jgi:hypothetical protein
LNSVAAETARNSWYEPLPASAISAAAGLQRRVRRARHQGRRFNISLLLSLLFHALLLSLIFGGQEFGIPGFALPWQERRVEVPDLRVELAPAPVADPKPVIQSAPVSLPPALTGQTAASAPAVVTFRSAKGPQVRPDTASVPRRTPQGEAGSEAKGNARQSAGKREGWSKGKGTDQHSQGEHPPEHVQGVGKSKAKGRAGRSIGEHVPEHAQGEGWSNTKGSDWHDPA